MSGAVGVQATVVSPRSARTGGALKLFRDIGLIYWRHMQQILRQPIWLIVGVSTPLLYLGLFAPLLKHLPGAVIATNGNVLNGFLPGILALLAFASGTGPGFNTIFELRAGVIERLRVTPVSRFAILIGPILASMVMMFVFDGVLIAVGAAFGFDVHWVGLAVLAVLLGLLMITMAAFSIAVALLTKEISSFAAVVNGLQLPVLLLAGVLLPLAIGPLWLRVLGHFNPLYYLVTASRVLAVGNLHSPHVWQAFAVLVPLCAIVLFWATNVMKKAVS
jgi:ABC-2 type transport system permease protein